MRSITAALVALILVLGAVACGGSNDAASTTTDTTTTSTETDTTGTGTDTTEAESPTVVHVTVKNGVPSGGIVRQSVSEGDSVVIVVDSDVADEIHVHGYDIKKDVTAGDTVRIPFTADTPGRFEIELESRGTQIAELTVNP